MASCKACWPTTEASAGEGPKDTYSGHAQVAYEAGALKALAQLGQSARQAGDAVASGLHGTVMMPLLAGMVAAFGLTPDRVPLEDLGHILQNFTGIYEGQRSAEQDATDACHEAEER